MESRVRAHYPNQLLEKHTLPNIYIADYTEQTRLLPVKRGVECHVSKPTDIEFFTVKNPNCVEVVFAPFDNSTFVDPISRTPLTQCECVLFPTPSIADSWVLFLELKYNEPKNNSKNIKKAKGQVVETLKYYWDKGIVTRTNKIFLVVSIPKDSIPFKGFTVTMAESTALKRVYNATIYGALEVEVESNTILKVLPTT